MACKNVLKIISQAQSMKTYIKVVILYWLLNKIETEILILSSLVLLITSQTFLTLQTLCTDFKWFNHWKIEFMSREHQISKKLTFKRFDLSTLCLIQCRWVIRKLLFTEYPHFHRLFSLHPNTYYLYFFNNGKTSLRNVQ